ncbi:MAG: hypothetical protein AAB948_04335 [Patescibacteria group bacterium]
MNPAEEIVKFWLQEKGYFVQSSIKVGRKEIDILAVHSLNPADKRHIEVQVSISPLATDPPEKEACDYQEKKFDDPNITQKIRERFGGDFPYVKEIVKGEVRYRGRDCFKLFSDECSSHGITVIPFSTVLGEVVVALGPGSQLNPIIKTVQLCKKFMPRIEKVK